MQSELFTPEETQAILAVLQTASSIVQRILDEHVARLRDGYSGRLPVRNGKSAKAQEIAKNFTAA